jgi:hypothetical protein
MLLGDAFAGIPDDEPRSLAVSQHAQANRTAARRVLDRVHDQVVEHVFDSLAIDHHGQLVVVQL